MQSGMNTDPGGRQRAFLPRASLPLLRAAGSEATVTGLAVALAAEAIEAARWTALAWPGQDTSAPGHASLACRYDESTPPGRALAAAGMLADACMRHRAFTGQDGLALARTSMLSFLGDHCAGFVTAVLAPLEAVRVEIEIDALLARPEPGDSPPPPPAPQATPMERRAFAGAVLDASYDDVRLAGLVESLDGFGAEHQADDGLAPGERTGAALAGVAAILQHAARAGVEPSTLEMILAAWTTQMPGRPEIEINLIRG